MWGGKAGQESRRGIASRQGRVRRMRRVVGGFASSLALTRAFGLRRDYSRRRESLREGLMHCSGWGGVISHAQSYSEVGEEKFWRSEEVEWSWELCLV
jgi:hypothetical protein